MHRADRSLALLLAVASFAASYTQRAAAGPQRSVVELFTSQGCSSCPPADAIVGRLRTDPALVVLSFHVNYWDGLGWKDAFASQASTDRQYAYARTLGERSVFTPQIIVNGTQSLVASHESEIRRAIVAASAGAFPIEASLSKQADGSFTVELSGPSVTADLWEVRYVRYAMTQINGGENGGRHLETFNNVTQLQRLGAFKPGSFRLPRLQQPEDGLAVLVQDASTGRMLGATAY